MNTVLDRVLTTGVVSADGETISLRHPEFPERLSHVDAKTGHLLQRVVSDIQPRVSLEIGLAYGVSTMFICEAIQRLSAPGRHIVLDPHQNAKWRGVGLRNLREAGFQGIVDFREEPSEYVLPRLCAEGIRVDMAFIDGLHRFDQAFIEFYFINRLLRPGGVLLFDDAARRSVNRVIRHALTYPAYEVYGSTESAASPSMLGRLRTLVADTPPGVRLVRPDVRRKDWDLGILGRCVALRKVSEDERATHWDADF